MKAEAVDISRSLLLEIKRKLSHGFASSDNIRKENNIPVFNIFPDVVHIVVETHPTVKIEQAEGIE